MKRMLLTSATAGVLVLLCVSLAGVANAGTLDNARIALRPAGTVGSFAACKTVNSGVDQDCTGYPVNNPQVSGGSFLYLILGRLATGAGGVSFGIQYSGMGVGWTSCTDGQDFTNNGWPASGGGNRLTWATCPQGDPERSATTASGLQTNFGYFYIYGYGGDALFEIVQNPLSAGPDDDELVVGDCGALESPISILQAGKMGYGGTQGYNSCADEVPVEPTTWGSLKSLYGSE